MLSRLFKKSADIEICNELAKVSDNQTQATTSYIHNVLSKNCSTNAADSDTAFPTTTLLISTITVAIILILILALIIYHLIKKPTPEYITNQDVENPSQLPKAEMIKAVSKLLSEIEEQINRIPTWKQSETTYNVVSSETLNLHAQTFQGKDRKRFIELATSLTMHHQHCLVKKGTLREFSQFAQPVYPNTSRSHSPEENDSIHSNSKKTTSKLAR